MQFLSPFRIWDGKNNSNGHFLKLVISIKDIERVVVGSMHNLPLLLTFL